MLADTSFRFVLHSISERHVAQYYHGNTNNSSGSRNFGEEGARNMKYKPQRVVVIFFGLFLLSRGGGMPPLPLLYPLLNNMLNYPLFYSIRFVVFLFTAIVMNCYAIE